MASSARLDELKKKFDENPRRYFAPLANEHRKSGDLDQAIALCRTHLPQQPGHISGHIVLAQALYEAGSLDESRDIFHSALGLDPENLIALRYLGDIARDSSDVETARTWYQRVLEVDPRNDEIVQLVRDLDAPRPVPSETVEEPALEEISAFAPPPAPSVEAKSAAPPVEDPRFAPLSLEELDVDESASTPGADASNTPNESPAPEPTSYDAHAAWSMAPTEELPLLDAPGIDPFDLDSAGSAESLFDSGAETPSHDDLLLSELSGATGHMDDLVEPNASYTQDSWSTPQPTDPEPAEPTAAASPFEEGAFYLEPPPPAPSEEVSSEPPAVTAASTDAPTVEASAPADESTDDAIAGFDALAAEYYVPVEESRRHSRPSLRAIEPIPEVEPVAEPVAGSIEQLAEQHTAEWQPPAQEIAAAASSADPTDGLGLEVMEFVPPTRDTSAPPSGFEPMADAEPAMGYAGETLSSEPSAPPAAFLTETMAELYLQQGFRNEALGVYRELLNRNPGDASLRDRIAQIESGSISSIGMASVSEEVVESALRRQHARPARSVRSFFASLAGRRAPAPQELSMPHAAEAPIDDYVAEASAASVSYAEPVNYAEPVSHAEPVAPSEPTYTPQATSEPASPERDDRITPLMSAAESLAAFDPFADTMDLPPADPIMPDVAPNVKPVSNELPESVVPPARPTPVSIAAQAPAARPTPMSIVAQSPVATAPERSEPTPAGRSLEELFPDTPITARTEAAAQTLATAFGRQEPQGRPTRAASNELSLDHVFRGAPESSPAPDGGFSFDQFFSDSRTSGGDTAASTATTSDTGRNSGSGDAHDIEQFTAWLEGLKKK